jgi:hypothetical protein
VRGETRRMVTDTDREREETWEAKVPKQAISDSLNKAVKPKLLKIV